MTRAHSPYIKAAAVSSIPAIPIMRLSLILLSAFSLYLPPLSEAGRTLSEDHRSYRTARNSQADPEAPRSAFTFKYTLITANSPDCEPSLVDNFPVRVQYRTISGSDGRGVSEWMDSPNMPGKHACTKY